MKCKLDKCLLCSNVSLKKNLCTKCNYNYYQIENDPSNIGEYINCYNNPEVYYLDNNLYKKCYFTCKRCNITGNSINHNCIECNDNYTLNINTNNYINCYKNCNIMSIIDDYISEKNNTGNKDIEYYDNILKLIENTFKENYNTSKKDNGQDEIIKTDKMTVTLTTVQNQKNNLIQNNKTIDLGEYENLLRNYYNISSDIT